MSDTIISSMNVCPKCKNANPDDSKFCMHCGSPITKTKSNKKLTISQIEKGKKGKSVEWESSFSFSKDGGDFKGINPEETNVELKDENGKILLKSKSSEVYLKVEDGKFVEVSPGQEVLINGKTFLVE
ncbi:MAG: zinc-ribbon domain-containing protein [Leptospiraceae bacterium]|nr:zinc-ribbon domain-containing protein [Leptospiraceae bacterium]